MVGPLTEERRTITAVPEGNLPRWVRDDISRSTPKDRRDAAMHHLEEGIARFADRRYRAAIDDLTAVKALSPRSALVRELLGLSFYYLENWAPALQELRAYRRFTGETIHMPVEIDCLRALRKNADVEKTFELFQELGGDKDTVREVAVVYASHLLDEGRVRDAWRVDQARSAHKPRARIRTPPLVCGRASGLGGGRQGCGSQACRRHRAPGWRHARARRTQSPALNLSDAVRSF